MFVTLKRHLRETEKLREILLEFMRSDRNEIRELRQRRDMLMAANNAYLQRARDAEAALEALKAKLTDCEPVAAELAEKIVEVLLADMPVDEAKKRHEVNILSDHLQTFMKDMTL